MFMIGYYFYGTRGTYYDSMCNSMRLRPLKCFMFSCFACSRTTTIVNTAYCFRDNAIMEVSTSNVVSVVVGAYNALLHPDMLLSDRDKVIWARDCAPILVIEEFDDEVCNQPFFLHLVGSLGGLHPRWNRFWKKVHLVFLGVQPQIHLLFDLHRNLHYTISPIEISDFVKDAETTSSSGLLAYLPDRDYVDEFPVMVLNSAIEELPLNLALFDKVASFINQHCKFEIDRGSH